MNFSDVTIAFSGHNIKEFAILAIESFLLHYPDLRSNILYFDDESTDGTAEALENRCIKVVTWDSDMLNSYQKFSKLKLPNDNKVGYVSARVSYIMNQLMRMCSTKYLLILDGDVVITSDGLLELMLDELEDNILVCQASNTGKGIECPLNLSKELEEYYMRYVNVFDEAYHSPRIYFLCCLLNMQQIKDLEIYGDRLDYAHLICMSGNIVDTGTDFYHRLMDTNTKFSFINFEIRDYLYHWGWLSSSMREVTGVSEDHRLSIQELMYKTDNTILSDIMKSVSINKRDLTKHLRYYQYKNSRN